VATRVVLHPDALAELISSPHGAVAQDLTVRAIRVQSRARELVSGEYVKVRTGRLRNSITYEIAVTARGLSARVGTNVTYAIWLHEGTGIYGARGAPITPKRGRFLVWTSPDTGQRIFARSVRGIRPRPFLRDALPAAR